MTTTKSKHTPGPWKVDPRFNGEDHTGVTIIHESEEISDICDIVMDYKDGMAEANAHLIAAAPELLEACKIALDRFETLQDSDEATEYDIKAMERLKLVISKSEGTK